MTHTHSAPAFSDISPGKTISGLEAAPVTIIQVAKGEHEITVTFRRSNGDLGEAIVFPESLEGLTVSDPRSASPFTADAWDFRLAAEALRIHTAALHDPMAAVTSSEIQPLPHQIRAVYEEMLPRIPLHFLLADDPGAGKTIMTGLYVKELLLRGDVKRCVIVCPGGLASQWQDELLEKFGMRFHIMTSADLSTSISHNPFKDHDLLIVRMDAVARSEDTLLPLLQNTTWDLAVVDEAHRMSASKGFRQELRKTKRFILGETLRDISRHLLLLTATPHNGDNEAFQAFLSLLDADRFEGAFQTSSDVIDTTGLMRRMVKEELLTFEGKPLFPERRAITVPYTLTDREMDLYESVTEYVSNEMKRAEATLRGAESTAIGFALTVLQRRLASSPRAILRSLERRRDRLDSLKSELSRLGVDGGQIYWNGRRLSDVPLPIASGDLDDLDHSAEEWEQLEEQTLVSPVTAARSLAELEAELSVLRSLTEQARRVVSSGEDRKWSELRRIIVDEVLIDRSSDSRRKLIIFTEHRDTLDYLCQQIRTVTGNPEAVVTIHGGTPRLERQRIRENFTHDDSVQFLVATDAAGEGLNLQAAYMMVNYDLPWNPNRIEQRFGRIHRIGQRHVCVLWNLVADQTREGAVYTRLLEKMETQRSALGTRVFDVLGDAFQDQPLRKLMMDAVRYIDDPARVEEINRTIDAEVSNGLDSLLEERALASETLSHDDLDQMRLAMDEARARRLQPHYISQFFHAALTSLGGRTVNKSAGTTAIRRLPRELSEWTRQNSLAIADRYDRITFDPETSDAVDGAELISLGHPLLSAVIALTLEKLRPALQAGTVLIDATDPGITPWLLVVATAAIRDGSGSTQSSEFSYIKVQPNGSTSDAGPAPYLDFEPLSEGMTVTEVLEAVNYNSWLGTDPTATAKAAVTGSVVRPLLSTTRQRIVPEIDRTRELVAQRLNAQQNYLATEAAKALSQQQKFDSGKEAKPPARSHSALMEQVRAMSRRLDKRLNELDLQCQLIPEPPKVEATALIIPSGLLQLLKGADSHAVAQHAKNTEEVDRRAIEAVMAAEQALGRIPEEMPHNNPGFDIRSCDPNSTEPAVIIEVKGRIEGADTFTLTHREALTGKNTENQHRLALVEVSTQGPDYDRVRYLVDYCRELKDTGMDQVAHVLNWKKVWSKGGEPK